MAELQTRLVTQPPTRWIGAAQILVRKLCAMRDDDIVDHSSDSSGFTSNSEADANDLGAMKYDIRTLSVRIRRFLDGERPHPVWEPVQVEDGVPAWNTSDHPRLKALRMLESPSYGNPDMLLYRLGHLETLDPLFVARMDDVLSGNGHVYLSNASGTGKTRMSFEILARHWGIYLTCYADYASDPYGSTDVGEAVSDMSCAWKLGSGFTADIPLSTRPSQAALEGNRRIAQFFFRRLILARLLIFNEFKKLVSERGIPEHEAILKWLMIQLRPGVLLGADVFRNMLLGLNRLHDDDITRLYGTVSGDLVSLFSFIVIDEAQGLLNTYRFAFAVANNRRHAPVLRELVICLGNYFPAARFVLSGVQFDLDVVSEALRASASLKKSVRHYHSFGHFASLQQCSTYMRHFLGDNVSNDNCELVYHWLHGRHRVIAVLVMLTLRFGVRNIVRVMDNLLYRLTGYQRPGFSILYSHLATTFNTIIQDEQAEESPAALVLRKSVLTFAVHRLPTTTKSHSRDIVHLALALYTSSAEEAAIFEPYIFLSLARWLASSPKYGIHGIIRCRWTDSNATYSLHSVAFIEGLVPCLMEAFRVAPTLDTMLLFPGLKPPWANHAARVVLPSVGESSCSTNISPDSGNANLIRCATSPADVFHWLHHASQPFLIPDPHLGADLLVMLEVHGCNVLICVHADPFASTRARRHSRVVPSSPEDFYKTDPEAHAQLIAILKSLPRILLDPGHARSKRAKTRPCFAKYNTLHLLCFDRPFRDEAYDPPVANINFDFLLQLSRPDEVSFASLYESISCPPALHH